MAKFNRFYTIITPIIIGLSLQALFIVLELKATPSKAAIQFAEKYFRLDPAMSDFLCSKCPSIQTTDIISRVIEKSINDTVKGGFHASMAKNGLLHVKTNTTFKNEEEADVHFVAYRKTEVSPIFLYIANFFDIGETCFVEETIKVRKESGRWKVCLPVFGLTTDQ